MTGRYDWKPFPHILSVSCPECDGEAKFEFATIAKINHKSDIPYFANNPHFEYSQFTDSCGHMWHAAIFFNGLNGTSTAVLKDLPPGYSHEDFQHSKYLRSHEALPLGTISSTCCAMAKKHELIWPDNSFWQIEYRGDVLWAFDRKMFLEVKDFIAGKNRDVDSSPFFLRYIPTKFKKASAREDLVAKMDAKLNGKD